MSEGIGTFNGLGQPRLGEYELAQQDPTIDIVTLTGSTGQTGDFLVCQDSDGSEVFVVSASGAMTHSGQTGAILSSSGAQSAFKVDVSSTGAIADGTGTLATGFLVSMSSRADLNAAFAYSVSSTAVHVGTCSYMFMSNGSKAPTNFLGMGSSAGGPGTEVSAIDNGFFDSSLKINTFSDTTTSFGGLKMMAGSVAYYMLAVRATAIT